MGDEAHIELPTFTLARAGGSFEIEPCPDHDGQWHVTFRHADPPEFMQVKHPGLGVVEVEYQPVTSHVDMEYLAHLMTPDEARDFLGWVDHVREHSVAHLERLGGAVKRAIRERNWTGLERAIEEIAVTDGVRDSVANAGLDLYKRLDAN